ncbi:hypothetical protein HU200_009398 [Digitaria exilis]|uniref:Uncharacterized protein n=1 Tax=Digitaria exilis TaxID=1010633 RepID=A0A835FLJ5_9POAL|nr:hypothetical protein HU200_009398 [Digitaria exilis]
MLLEIATAGKKLAEARDVRDLVDAVRECYHRGAVLEMADERLCLDDMKERRQVGRVLAVGLLCSQLQRQDRPDITDAVKLLSDLSHPLPDFGAENNHVAQKDS